MNYRDLTVTAANKILHNLKLHPDGIWGEVTSYGEQLEEKALRTVVSTREYVDYLQAITKSHSIPVMDSEIRKFISVIPKGGIILDVGGGWGWHWRKINNQRPDLTIVIVDLVRENLVCAKQILKEGISKGNIFLVHGDACFLQFDAKIFNGVWSVQATQHIPDYNVACSEIYRVLKSTGVYWDYGLNNAEIIRIINKLFLRDYHISGKVSGTFFLRRINKEVLDCVEQVFNHSVNVRYSELLFTPDLGCRLGASENSMLGHLDSYLSGKSIVGKLIARQCSFHVKK